MKYLQQRTDWAVCRQSSKMSSDIHEDASGERSMQLLTLGFGLADGRTAEITHTPSRSCVPGVLGTAIDRQAGCFGCGAAVQDEHILRVEPDMCWHATCLRCHACHRQLDETCTCFVKGGRIYCKPDYHRLFAAKCAACGSPFNKNEFVMKAMHTLYHIACFRCVVCNRQLMPGDEFTVRPQGLLCKVDSDVLSNASSGEYHQACTADREDVEDAAPTQNCRVDCAVSCSSGGRDDNFADGGGGSHTKVESIRLPALGGKTGESRVLATPAAAAATTTVSGQNRVKLAVAVTPGSANGYHAGRHCSPTAVALSQASRPQQHRESNGGGSGSVVVGKTTRVRTVLNEKQLHMLRACYAANPRPDALMKEQLVDMTGLSPRVIRVWFQNKRCKDKKKSILMKQLQQQQLQQQPPQPQQQPLKSGAAAGTAEGDKIGSYDSASEDMVYLVDDDSYVPQGSAASSQYSGTSDSPLSNE